MHRRPCLCTTFVALALACAPLLYGQQDSSDARVVIHVDSLDRAAFSNVAELLQARVPGLHIARTGDGGMRWFMRGPSSVAESHPMVLVDGVRINVAGSELAEMGTRPPVLDEIDIESVERIEIWSGAATGARYGTGAGNGVIRIVTAIPRAGPTSFRITALASALEENVDYPANFNRPGVDTAGRVVRCTLQREAVEQCTPTGPLTSINVLESDSPFATGWGGRVAASLTSGSERLAWRGGATFDHQGSTSGTLAHQRVHLQGGATFRPAAAASVALKGYWARAGADLPARNVRSLLRQGLMARADSVWPGFVKPPAAVYDVTRFGGVLAGQWQPRAWLDAHLTSGIARMTDDDDLAYTTSGVFSPGSEVVERGERRRRDWNARMDAEARYGKGAVRHATSLVVEHAVGREEEEHSATTTFPGGGSASTGFWLTRRLVIAGVGGEQRVRLWERATLLGGARFDQVRVNDVRFDVPIARHVALVWDGAPLGTHAWGDVRLRAALGDVATVPQTTRIFVFVPGGASERPKPEVTRGREAGVDAAFFRDRLGASFTWYYKRVSNVGTLLSGPFPGGPSFARIELLNRGVEASLKARLVEASRLNWTVRASYAYNHNEVTRGIRTPIAVGGDPFTGTTFSFRQWIVPGQPLGAHRSVPFVSIQDLDGDGLLDDACFVDSSCEVIVGGEEFSPAYPPTSASVETTVRFGAFTLRALLDHRSGHTMHNSTLDERCMREECRPLYDRTTPLLAQAGAMRGFILPGVPAQDASYTKLREVSLQFQAPGAWARGLGATHLVIALAGRNLATWTDYPGLDPESTSLHWIPLMNMDSAAEPLARRFSIRMTATK